MNLLLYFYLYDAEHRKMLKDSILCISVCYYDSTEHANKPLTKIPVKQQGCTMQDLFLIGSVKVLKLSEFTTFLMYCAKKIFIPCFFLAAIDNN